MLVRIDKEADVIYAHWGEPRGTVYSREVSPGVFLEEDESGTIVGLEVLAASTRGAVDQLDHVDVQIYSSVAAKG